MNIAFLKAAGERAAKTFAQTAAALLVAGLDKVDLFHLEYRQIGLSALTAAVLSLATSAATPSAVSGNTEDETLPADELADAPVAPVDTEATLDPQASDEAK